MEYLPAYVKILAYLFVMVYMLSIPLETPRGEIVATLRDFRLMGYGAPLPLNLPSAVLITAIEL